MKVIIDARKLLKAERIQLIGNAIKKAGNGKIVVLADDENAKEDISLALNRRGWIINGVESDGDGYRITISKQKEERS